MDLGGIVQGRTPAINSPPSAEEVAMSKRPPCVAKCSSGPGCGNDASYIQAQTYTRERTMQEQPGDEWAQVLDGVLMFMIKVLVIAALIKYLVT